MFKSLMPLLVCPACKGVLDWTVRKEDEIRVIDAKIGCGSCSSSYFVEDGVGCFLLEGDENVGDWQGSDSDLADYFAEHPGAKEKLMNTPVEDINAADLQTRARVLRESGDETEADKVGELAFEKAYTKEYRNAITSQLAYVTEALKNKATRHGIAAGLMIFWEVFLNSTASACLA